MMGFAMTTTVADICVCVCVHKGPLRMSVWYLYIILL